ncbi:MAG: cbb3-type cytochrome oxidase assembly protein CcoS [Chthoniobacterales bacterium]|jgi:cbb3-type cytochrome oxidase maturation protein
MTSIVYILLVAGLIFFGGSTLAAFYWAAKEGQFRNLEAGSRSIFDDDEPVGAATDAFADKQPDRPLRRAATGRSLT